MSNINFSTLEAFGKSAGLGSSGILASLNSAFGNGSGGTSLFSSLLNEVHTDTLSTTTNAANTAVSATQGGVTSSNAADPFTALQDVALAWKGFVQKWQNFQSSKPASAPNHATTGSSASSKTNSTVVSTNGNSNNASGTITTTVTADADGKLHLHDQNQDQTQTQNSSGTAATDPSSQTTSSGDSNTTPPTISDLLTELQAIMQMLHQQIEAAQTGNAGLPVSTAAVVGPQLPAIAPTDPTAAAPTTINAPASADDGSATSDTSTAGALLPVANMITELLMLSKYAEKILGVDPKAQAAQTVLTGSQSATPQTTPTDVASLDAQLRSNLKTLVDALQTKVTANDNASNSPAIAATPDFTATVSVPDPSTDTTKPLATQDIIRDAVAVAETFVKQLDTFFMPQANVTSAFAPTAIVPTPTAGGDSAMNSDLTDGQGNALNNASDLTANGQPLTAGDGTKATDPYSFANQLSATRAANGATGLPSAVEQVMFQLSRNVKNGNDQMTLQLHPADLGSIDIKLNFASDGSVQGTVVASNPTTLDLLLKDVRGLERALQDAGLSADPGSLQFSLGGQPGDTSKQTASNSSSGKSYKNGQTSDDALLAVDPSSTDQTQTWYVTPSRVNLQV